MTCDNKSILHVLYGFECLTVYRLVIYISLHEWIASLFILEADQTMSETSIVGFLFHSPLRKFTAHSNSTGLTFQRESVK